MPHTDHAPAYRWVILTLLVFMALVMNIIIFQIGGLAHIIMREANAGPADIGLLLGVSLLTAAIFGIPCGAWADRFGVKIVVLIFALVNVAGAVGRLHADSVSAYVLWMFLCGFGNAALNANFVKLLSAWFPVRQIGLGVGCYFAGIGLGSSLGLATAPMFPSLNAAFTFSAALMGLATLLWFLLVRSAPKGVAPPPPQPVWDSLKVVLPKAPLWVGALAMFLFMGAYVTPSGLLAHSLNVAKGVDFAVGARAASGITLAFVAASLLSPVVLKVIGSSRRFLIAAQFAAAALIWVFWQLPFGFAALACLYVGIFLTGATVPVIMSLPMTLKSIGPAYAGSAGGLLSTVQMLGGFILPSVLPALANGEPGPLFMLIAGCLVLMGLVLIALPELYRNT